MFRVREYAFATPADLGGRAAYRKVCKVANLTPIPDGYGMLLVVDESDEKVTLAAADVEYVRMLIAAGPEVLRGMEIGPDVVSTKFVTREGWPDDWI